MVLVDQVFEVERLLMLANRPQLVPCVSLDVHRRWVENLYLSFLGGKHIRDVVVVGFVHKVHLVDRSLRQGLLYRHVLVMAQTGALAFAFEKVHHAFDQVLRLVVVTNGHLRNVGGCV